MDDFVCHNCGRTDGHSLRCKLWTAAVVIMLVMLPIGLFFMVLIGPTIFKS